MITRETIHELKPGAIIWHVYGGFSSAKPARWQLLTGPVSWQIVYAHRPVMVVGLLPEDYKPEWLLYRPDWSTYGKHWPSFASLQDCGIGANYNDNRLFTSYEAAEAFARRFA